MAASQDVNRAAVIESPHARISIQNRSIPSPGINQVLVRNHAVASNPIDWQMQKYNILISSYPIVLGSDISGTVTAVGPSVTDIRPSDRVSGLATVLLNSDPDHGAFQTYTILDDIALIPLPPNISFEEGSVLPMAAATAALGLFVNLGIPLPEFSSSNPTSNLRGEAILVWGGASSVGTMVIQMAKKLGLTVIATAKSIHHAYLKSLGASFVVDYKEPDVVVRLSEIIKDARLGLAYAFDCVGEGATFSQCSEVLTASSPTPQEPKLVLVRPWPEKRPEPDGITISQVFALELVQKRRDLCRWLFREWLPAALADGSIVPSPRIDIVEGGLESTQVMWDRHMKGVSGQKLVLRIT